MTSPPWCDARHNTALGLRAAHLRYDGRSTENSALGAATNESSRCAPPRTGSRAGLYVVPSKSIHPEAPPITSTKPERARRRFSTPLLPSTERRQGAFSQPRTTSTTSRRSRQILWDSLGVIRERDAGRSPGAPGARIALALAVCVVVYGVVGTLQYVGERNQITATRRPSLTPLLAGRELGWARHVLEQAGIAVTVERRATAGGPRPLWSKVVGVTPQRMSALARPHMTILATGSAAPPLRLPSRARCRPSPVHAIANLRDSVAGRGPLYLGGINQNGVVRYSPVVRAAFLYFVAPHSEFGPFVVRGARLHGPGNLAFEQNPARASDGVLVVGGRHEVRLPADTGLQLWGVSFRFGAPGCYGLQIDGFRSSEVVTFRARPD